MSGRDSFLRFSPRSPSAANQRAFATGHDLLIRPSLDLLEDASCLPLGARRDEELCGTNRVGAFAAFTSEIDSDALGFESALGDFCLDP
jgi:hypothetical protein